MKFAKYFILVTTLILGSQALSQDNSDLLEKVFVGIGGQSALKNLNTFVIEASGKRWIKDEGVTPYDSAQESNSFTTNVSYDLTQDRLRLDYENTITFFGFDEPQAYSDIIVGTTGYITGADNIFGIPERPMSSDRWAALHKQQRLLNPHLILLDILADPSIVSVGGVQLLNGSIHHLLIVKDEVHPLRLYINASTGQLAKITTLENHYLHRDVSLEVFYLDWQMMEGGLLFPREVYLASNEHIIREEKRASVQVNVSLDDDLFSFPEADGSLYDENFALRGAISSQFYLGFAAIGIPQGGTDNSTVSAEMLSPGIYHLTGGSHHSMVIEQENGLVVVEAPLYETRSKAILDWISSEFPDKPITYVIASHSHEDHSAGLRTFVARGIPVIISEISVDFMAEVFKASSTVLPDELEQNPKKATIEPVPLNTPYTLSDIAHPINIYHMDNVHADDLVMVHLPNEEILFVVDVYSPGLPLLFPSGPSSVYNAIKTNDIKVTMLVGGHAGIGTFEELEATVNQ